MNAIAAARQFIYDTLAAIPELQAEGFLVWPERPPQPGTGDAQFPLCFPVRAGSPEMNREIDGTLISDNGLWEINLVYDRATSLAQRDAADEAAMNALNQASRITETNRVQLTVERVLSVPFDVGPDEYPRTIIFTRAFSTFF